MKYDGNNGVHSIRQSHPTRGAWIEINQIVSKLDTSPSHPKRGAWVVISPTIHRLWPVGGSLATRGAWIEME